MASDVTLIGVAGSGIMGSGIAQAAAMAGYDVLLYGRREQAVARALDQVRSSLAKLHEKGKVNEEPETVMSRIMPAGTLEAFSRCNLTVEAVSEDEPAKNDLLKKLARIIPGNAVLATTTSSLSVTRLGDGAGIADRFIGMHFSNPPALMEMLELVPGKQTSGETIRIATEVAMRMGKVIVRSADSPGFVFNRLLVPMINDAFEELGEGVACAEEIDSAMKVGAHHPMGPLALADMIGLDVCLAVMETLDAELGGEKYRPSSLLREYVAKGWLGRKAGRGVYLY